MAVPKSAPGKLGGLIRRTPRLVRAAHNSHIAKQHHKTKIHVALLVTVKQCRARVRRDKVYLCSAVRLHHHHVLTQRRERFTVQAGDLERVAM